MALLPRDEGGSHWGALCPFDRLRAGLGQNVFIANDVIIGNNVKIQNNVSVYSGVELEACTEQSECDDVFCGPSCVFTNVSNPRSQIVRHHLYERTLVRRGATIGANATIVCPVTIGQPP